MLIINEKCWMHNGLPENACRKFIHGKVPSGQSHSNLDVIKSKIY
jgi:hypothetical protein